MYKHVQNSKKQNTLFGKFVKGVFPCRCEQIMFLWLGR